MIRIVLIIVLLSLQLIACSQRSAVPQNTFAHSKMKEIPTVKKTTYAEKVSDKFRTWFDTRPLLIKRVVQPGIQFIKYGDTYTLILDTDQFFYFNEAKLKEWQYGKLRHVVELLKAYPRTHFYVAAFSDDVGEDLGQRLSEQRAQTMLAWLWANGVNLQRLHASGYGAAYTIATNETVLGSALNRRIEIQWEERN